MNERRSAAERTSWWASTSYRMRGIWQEIAKFGVVGMMALVVDVGLFNLLRFAGPDGEGLLFDKPLTAKVISTVLATTFSYFANRHWTFAERKRSGFMREYVLFFVINGIAMIFPLGMLWFSHYALGLTSPLADNISANVIGLILGTVFRFWAYRTFVFTSAEESPADEGSELEPASLT